MTVMSTLSASQMVLRSRTGSDPSDRYTGRLSLLLEMPVFAARVSRSLPRRTTHTFVEAPR
nr:MAG TPA: hypothetical protein [Caudoviricetes sp.]DAY14016.1 MAG TPA: hypothetical protein [Caudoviricetes sp.]